MKRQVRVNNRRISPGAMFALVYCTTVAYGIILGPKMLIGISRESAPLMGLLGLGLAALLLLIFVKMAERFPSLTIVQWSVRMFGPFGYPLAAALLLYLLLLVATHSAEYSSLLQIMFLDRTPVWPILAFGYLLVLAGAYSGLEAFTRFMQIITYIELAVLPPIILLGPTSFEISHLQPWYPLDLKSWLLGPLVAVSSFLGFGHAPLGLRPYFGKGNLLRPALLGLIVAGLAIWGFTVDQLGVFGPDVLPLLRMPTFEYSQVIELPQTLSFLSRYSLFFGAIWMLAVLKLTTLDVIIVAIGIKHLLGLKSEKSALIPLTVASFLASGYICKSQIGEQAVAFSALVGTVLAVGVVPLLGLTVWLMKGRAGKIAAESERQD